MQETSKSLLRRSYDRRFTTRYLVGNGVDIGAGMDSIGRYRALFPLMGDVRGWDLEDGDAMLLQTVADESYDFVHSSHCLEHLVDPKVALANWIRVCKPGGHIVVMIPDEDLYEQGVFPSTFNRDHKWTFTIAKKQSWSPRSVSVVALLALFCDAIEIVKIELLDSNYFYDVPRFDQTMTMLGESAIEFVIRKRAAAELERKGRLAAPA
jgi:SAM-dependent methyltransferase